MKRRIRIETILDKKVTEKGNSVSRVYPPVEYIGREVIITPESNVEIINDEWVNLIDDEEVSIKIIKPENKYSGRLIIPKNYVNENFLLLILPLDSI